MTKSKNKEVFTAAQCLRMANQCWESAGFARADKDIRDATRWTAEARKWDAKLAAMSTKKPKVEKVKKTEQPSRCDNCGWTGIPLFGLEEIVDLLQRIEPGGEVPSGECRECDCLCYLVKKK
jgi:hypothetical protein